MIAGDPVNAHAQAGRIAYYALLGVLLPHLTAQAGSSLPSRSSMRSPRTVSGSFSRKVDQKRATPLTSFLADLVRPRLTSVTQMCSTGPCKPLRDVCKGHTSRQLVLQRCS